MPGWATKKLKAHHGLMAWSTSGRCAMPWIPSIPSTTNQSTITGPKRMPIRAVPCFWIRNRPISSTTVIGTTQWPTPGRATSRPSTADSTEIAGVIMLSP
ncbi:hypothetical protein D3C72_2102960 [compost metagenome]